jgi:endogenous inhibitor of DNA gyrase (YacG/DUF329 family)
MNCDRCGKKVNIPQYMYEVFLLCPTCMKKVKQELKGKKYEN